MDYTSAPCARWDNDSVVFAVSSEGEPMLSLFINFKWQGWDGSVMSVLDRAKRGGLATVSFSDAFVVCNFGSFSGNEFLNQLFSLIRKTTAMLFTDARVRGFHAKFGFRASVLFRGEIATNLPGFERRFTPNRISKKRF